MPVSRLTPTFRAYPRNGERADVTKQNFIRRFFFDTAGAKTKLGKKKRRKGKDFAACGQRPGVKIGQAQFALEPDRGYAPDPVNWVSVRP